MIFEPAQVHPHNLTILYLHDADSDVLNNDATLSLWLSEHGIRFAAPISGPTWWLDYPTSQQHDKVTPIQSLAYEFAGELQRQWSIPPRCIGVLGVGMGGQGALMLSYRHPRTFPVVAAIAPAVDFHQLVPHDDPFLTETFGSREWARQHTAILHVHPLNWPSAQFFCCDPQDPFWFDSSDRLHMKLHSMGIPHTCDLETTTNGDPRQYVPRMLPIALDFLRENVTRERLRIV